MTNHYGKILFISFVFIIFLLQFSFELAGDGISANYLFIFFPLAIWLLSGSIKLPPKRLQSIIVTYVLIFILAILYQFQYFAIADRRIAAFVLFMTGFVFCTINITKDFLLCFKIALVLVSVYYSLQALVSYLFLGGLALGYDAKGAVGSQRFGFVYCMAIWLLQFYMPSRLQIRLLKYLLITLISIGLFLTFSRSGVVAIIGSIVFYIGSQLSQPKGVRRFIKVAFIFLFLSIILYFVILQTVPFVVDFYLVRLFSLETSTGEMVYDLDNPESSEGWRIYMMRVIGEFVLFNPVTGSGYLGSWILFEDRSGSAHSQYLDVLFRTGFIGFGLYVWLLYRLLQLLRYREPGLFYGLVAVLIYGLFHETFKLSHGAFIFSFLVGMLAQNYRDNHLS